MIVSRTKRNIKYDANPKSTKLIYKATAAVFFCSVKLQINF